MGADFLRALTRVLAIAVLGVVGCSERPATQIFFTVDTDLVPGTQAEDELDSIFVRVLRREGADPDGRDPESRPIDERALDESRPVGDVVKFGDGNLYSHRFGKRYQLLGQEGVLSIEIGLAEVTSGALAYVQAFALRGDEVTVHSESRLGFAKNRHTRVVVWLSAACLNRECPVDQTCREGECVPVDVPEQCLDRNSDGPLLDDSRYLDCPGFPTPPDPDAGCGEERVCDPGDSEMVANECGVCGGGTQMCTRVCTSRCVWSALGSCGSCMDPNDFCNEAQSVGGGIICIGNTGRADGGGGSLLNCTCEDQPAGSGENVGWRNCS